MALTVERKMEVRQKAEALLLASKVSTTETPVNTGQIARHLGYEVKAFEPDWRTEDISGAVDHENRVILLNSREPAVRKHFTLAHEIGHVALHAGQSVVDFRAQMAEPTTDREWEANYFASNLLMPSNTFYQQWIALGGDKHELGRVFGVSKEAVGIRARELGLL